MGYINLKECITDLEKCGQLIKIDDLIDANLEIGILQRRLYENKAPAVLFTNIKNSNFPMLANLFGTMQRTRYIFRDTLELIEKLVNLKINPMQWLKNPFKYMKTPLGAYHLLPKKVKTGDILYNTIDLKSLPQLKSWPMDGGAFITLPQVYTESPYKKGFKNSNLGMYRIQISGNEYLNDEVGVHYQIHRGMGIHHSEAIAKKEPLKVNIFVGGAPAMTVAAVMPLPEGMPEISFAGLLGGHRINMICKNDSLPIYSEADFCLSGYIIPDKLKSEGPFGDHLGYYSLTHKFPVMKVEKIYHRKDAIWPFTTVGRPPQEDTSFGEFIHELTGNLIPNVLPGVKAVHAVDAAGVHPLLLAIGKERYVPYSDNGKPLELLTQANAILGQGQLSLAKYLFIANEYDNQELDVNDIQYFFKHILERVNWRKDIHFQTSTTIDTLDYSGNGFNEGSKVVITALGNKIRTLEYEIPNDINLPIGFTNPKIAMPGILIINAPKSNTKRGLEDKEILKFVRSFKISDSINKFPLIILVDDSEFTARNINNFLWVTFTRSNPASDIYGIGAKIIAKHWSCSGSLVIDARIKPHHAPPLVEDKEAEKRVDEFICKNKVLKNIIK